MSFFARQGGGTLYVIYSLHPLFSIVFSALTGVKEGGATLKIIAGGAM